jgi:hypothetical protein
MLEMLREFSLGVHWLTNTLLNVEAGKNLINIIVKELVLV